MRFEGQWLIGRDGILSPVIRARVVDFLGDERDFEFLVDSGADRTVFSSQIFQLFAIEPEDCIPFSLEGVGGRVEAVLVDTRILFTRSDNVTVTMNGRFAAFTDPNALEISILGRDILNSFALIVDRPGDVVCLLIRANTAMPSRKAKPHGPF